MDWIRDPLITKIAPSYVSEVSIGYSDPQVISKKENQYHLHSFYKFIPDYPNMTEEQKLICSLALQYFYSICERTIQRGLINSFFEDQVNTPWTNRPTLNCWLGGFLPGIFSTGKAS